MKRAIFTGTVVTALIFATTAMAAEHNILILPDTYFPETTYLNPGDTVKFINISGDEHTIIAANEAWTIGPLDAEEEYSMVVDSEIERTFHNANAINSDGTYAVTGDISFDASPVN
ncbi:hypothetical protein [uncultured Tateyamaria sp.]|uniref:cupredoxin domain-containing protein n=1 Tax=Tateyamaria sp. 1078 TaxID=3417464 RepID=UPI00262724DF|nr:hypothetical protein [uncultured Tateyamaria sp.]